MPLIYHGHQDTPARLKKVHIAIRGTDRQKQDNTKEIFNEEGQCQACHGGILSKDVTCPNLDSQIKHVEKEHTDWFRFDRNYGIPNGTSYMIYMKKMGKLFAQDLLQISETNIVDTFALLSQSRDNKQFVMHGSPFPYNNNLASMINRSAYQDEETIQHALHHNMVEMFNRAGKEVKQNRGYGQPVGGKIGHNIDFHLYLEALKRLVEHADDVPFEQEPASASSHAEGSNTHSIPKKEEVTEAKSIFKQEPTEEPVSLADIKEAPDTKDIKVKSDPDQQQGNADVFITHIRTKTFGSFFTDKKEEIDSESEKKPSHLVSVKRERINSDEEQPSASQSKRAKRNVIPDSDDE